MATPTLMGLPTEMLDEIIQYTLPEGFESLASTCKELYALCTPYIEHHNQLSFEFRHFTYRPYEYQGKRIIPPINLAFDLITRIAMEPRVARYIIHADLSDDDWLHRPRIPPDLPGVDDDGPLVALFARSPYLAQAGLDWKEFYAQIVESYHLTVHYSQYAAAFLLTLLPNAKTFKLPMHWDPEEKTNKLLEVIVREAKQPDSLWNEHSLAKVTEFELYCRAHRVHTLVDLNEAVPFLALPNVRSFCGGSYFVTSDTSMLLVPKDPYLCYGEALESVNLDRCCFDEVAIAEFLKHTPHLRVLQYLHVSKRHDDNQDWDICKFVTAIEREVGRHLEELSISIRELRGMVHPGKASMRGFQRLQKLKFPLEFAMCNVQGAEFEDATVTAGLKDQADGGGHHALKAMFPDLAAIKDSKLHALKEIRICYSWRYRPDDWYRKEWKRLAMEAEKAGVLLDSRYD
ncbi:hypothetical protein F4801DRAFT_587209 [Xylaria longipes]|nr:hypothetical protein F4801DRAFT_587209 [Xylaria longipes]